MAPFILGKAQGYKNRRRIPDQTSHSFNQIVGKSIIKIEQYDELKILGSKVSQVQVHGIENPNFNVPT